MYSFPKFHFTQIVAARGWCIRTSKHSAISHQTLAPLNLVILAPTATHDRLVAQRHSSAARAIPVALHVILAVSGVRRVRLLVLAYHQSKVATVHQFISPSFSTTTISCTSDSLSHTQVSLPYARLRMAWSPTSLIFKV